MSTMVFQVVDRTFLILLGAAPPTDGEWQELLDATKRHGIEGTSQLVYTEGGLPTAAQRAALARVLAGQTVPVAVLADGWAVRAAVTIAAWFTWRRLRAFRTEQIDEALAFLEIPRSRAAVLVRTIDALRGAIATRVVSALELWTSLERIFAEVLAARREGRFDDIALCVADLTSPLGFALAQAVHAEKRGPDPAALKDSGALFTVAVLKDDEIRRIVAMAVPAIACAAAELNEALEPHHVRVLMGVTEKAVVLDLPVSRLMSTPRGVS